MANVDDGVLQNLLSRLPGKPLLRFRCVSKHWNCLISNPYFMKSRARRMILLPFPRPLAVIDDNVPLEDEAHSMVRIPFPFEHTRISIVGTLNGIVLLALYDTSSRCQLILYNPLTCASKILVDMDAPSKFVFGFGYGATTTDDLKIVRFEAVENTNRFLMYKCDAFDLKTSSWTSPQYYTRYFYFGGDAGVFINGFLNWSVYFDPCFGIMALNVKEMVLSRVDIPIPLHNGTLAGLLLGSLDGCLCMVNNGTSTFTFDMWLMKEEGVWLKSRSFRFRLEGNVFYPICILGDGRILIKSSSTQLVIYDTSNDSYKAFNGLATLENFLRIDEVLYTHYPLMYSRSIEYVESLVSPSNLCFM